MSVASIVMPTAADGTSRAYYGYASASPPSNGVDPTGKTEYDTTRYTNVHSDDSLSADGCGYVDGYAAHLLEFQIPTGLRDATITQIDCTIKGVGYANGESVSYSGIRAFLYRNTTNTWVTQGGTTGTSKSFTITSNFSYYLDGNYRFRVLVLTYGAGNTANADGSILTIQYGVCSITYADIAGVINTLDLTFNLNDAIVRTF